MQIRKAVAAAAIIAGLAVIPLAAQKAHEMAASQHQQMFTHIAKVLNLTEAQKASVQQMFKDAQAQATPLMEETKQTRTAIEAAVKTNNTAEITRLAQRQGQLQGQISEMHYKFMAAFYAQLTPEQKTTFDELKDQFFSHIQNFQHRAPKPE